MSYRLITEDERRAYGDEALSVMERKAKEAFLPVVEMLDRQNRLLRQEIQQVKAHDVYSALDEHLPNWREINQSDEWKAWLRLPDLINGCSRQNLLDRSFAAGNANQILALFHAFGAESGAPQSSGSTRTPRRQHLQQPVVTNLDLERHYQRARSGYYKSDAQRDAEEARIHAAVHRGLFRRV